MSMDKNDFGKKSPNIVGKLRSNFLGTKFNVYDAGANPKKKNAPGEPLRTELGLIKYVG